MADKLTNRQGAVLKLIAEGIKEKGYPPTFREIGADQGIKSTNGVRGILEALEKKGYILRHRYQSRAIELSDAAREFLGMKDNSATVVELSDSIVPNSQIIQIPILGNVAAGHPLLADQHIDGYIAIDADYAPRGESFALRVKGDSMINAGIHDGDVVFCRRQNSADKGEMVVAMIGDEATVKYFFPEKDRIVLQPDNEYFGPITVERDAPGFAILGKVVGLYRRY